MSVATYVDQFTAASGSVPFTQARTGYGFQPKALMAQYSPENTPGYDTTSFHRNMIGLAADASGGTVQMSAGGLSPYYTSGNNGRYTQTAKISQHDLGSEKGAFEIDSWDAGGVTLNWLDEDSGRTIIIWALGGSDITDVDVVSFNAPGTGSTFDVTSPGFQPDAIVCIGISNTITAGQTTTYFMGVGVAVGSAAADQWFLGTYSQHGANPQNTKSMMDDGYCYGQINSSSVNDRLSVNTFLSTGVRFNDVDTTTDLIIMLAIKGGQWSAGTDTQKTSTGTKQTAVTGTPAGAFLASRGDTTALGTARDDANALYGWADGTNEAATWFRVIDNVAPDATSAGRVNDGYSSTKAALMVDTDDATGADAEGDVSFGANYMEIDWTTADAVARIFGYLTVAPEPTGGGTGGRRFQMTNYERKYGVALGAGTYIQRQLELTGDEDFADNTDWTPQAGDVQISKDGAAFTNIATLPTYSNGSWRYTLSASELQAKTVEVKTIDAVLKHDSFTVETFGDANALRQFEDDDFAASMDTYQAKVWFTDDDGGTTDRYAVAFYKNGSRMAAADVTNPEITVYNAAGSNRFTSKTLTQVTGKNVFTATEVTNRLDDGTQYYAEVTHDDMPSPWIQPVSRDSAAA